MEKEKEILEESKETVSKNFIEQEIDRDLAEGVYSHVQTRFPPEPNGYLHIGHAKSILLNYGLACRYGVKFNLRFDDTNPTKEDIEFVESIKADVQWLGADFEDRLFFASNYFDAMYECALLLIRKGKAFVCDLSAEEIRQYRGDFKTPGKESPCRNRSVEENLRLFEAGRKIQGRGEGAASKDRHGFPQHQYAGPGDLPCGPHEPPQHRGQVVHLSHV